MIHFTRESGILLHITSLPGSYGVGEIGSEAIRFINILKKMNQQLWQILPLGHTGHYFSPYDLLSSFAGNPLIISLESLVSENYLTEKEISPLFNCHSHSVKFTYLNSIKMKLLELAAQKFLENASENEKLLYDKFCEENSYWLENYALFWTLKVHSNQKSWTQWKDQFKYREETSINQFKALNIGKINRTKCIQYFFYKQWSQIKQYANKNGIRIIGDLPLYVSHDSAEVWANRELFTLDSKGNRTFVSGVPPCYFSKTGQLWGHPLYRWDLHKNTRFHWWKSRLKRLYDLVDIVRIDHFNGFAKYWQIPVKNKTAINGEWKTGPGESIFNEIFDGLGLKSIIAEDLGEAADAAEELKNKFNFPGMKILQFAFKNGHNLQPHDYPENCVVYTGTHDNDTTVGWFKSTSGNGNILSQTEINNEKIEVLKYLKTDGTDIHWDLIKLALKSNANTVIIPLQDIMGLDSSARMNIPGTNSGNWRWRFNWDLLTSESMDKMRDLTLKYRSKQPTEN